MGPFHRSRGSARGDSKLPRASAQLTFVPFERVSRKRYEREVNARTHTACQYEERARLEAQHDMHRAAHISAQLNAQPGQPNACMCSQCRNPPDGWFYHLTGREWIDAALGERLPARAPRNQSRLRVPILSVSAAEREWRRGYRDP